MYWIQIRRVKTVYCKVYQSGHLYMKYCFPNPINPEILLLQSTYYLLVICRRYKPNCWCIEEIFRVLCSLKYFVLSWASWIFRSVDEIGPCALYYRTRLRCKPKFSNWSKTCNIAATCMKFGVTKFQVCSWNNAGFGSIWKFSKLWLKPWSSLIKSGPGS